MNIRIDISTGEFLDKLSILELKLEKIADRNKKSNIRKEYDIYNEQLKLTGLLKQEVDDFLQALRQVNGQLWEIEDQIRDKEAKGEFDEEFINLARSVYKTNDRRAAIKKQINDQFGSDLKEEKSYRGY